jgi:hypothetical protein
MLQITQLHVKRGLLRGFYLPKHPPPHTHLHTHKTKTKTIQMTVKNGLLTSKRAVAWVKRSPFVPLSGLWARCTYTIHANIIIILMFVCVCLCV